MYTRSSSSHVLAKTAEAYLGCRSYKYVSEKAFVKLFWMVFSCYPCSVLTSNILSGITTCTQKFSAILICQKANILLLLSSLSSPGNFQRIQLCFNDRQRGVSKYFRSGFQQHNSIYFTDLGSELWHYLSSNTCAIKKIYSAYNNGST